MANYYGNPQGGVKLVGPEQQTAAGAFQQMLGNVGGGMGLGAFLGGNQPVALPVASDPLMGALASAGGTDPMAALMGLAGSGATDPVAILMSAAAGSGVPASAEPAAADPQAQLEDAVVNALSNPDFARQLVRSEPSVLQKVVKLLSNNARLG